MTDPDVVILVPRRADGGHRDSLWAFARKRWEADFPNWAIFEGHHDDGPFNRSAAINAAAREAGEWDLALIVDSDVAIEAEQVRVAVGRARGTGRMTLAYDGYRGLREDMTKRVLGGYDGDWTSGIALKMTTHISSVVAVPRALWKIVGGFDERVEGWGADDTIFAHACRVLGGGVERVPGLVWHLWHPPASQVRARPLPPEARASKALASRYFSEHTPAGLSKMLDEKRAGESVCLVVMTNGRRDCIATNLPVAHEKLHGLPITRTIIHDDSGDMEYQAWLRWRFPDYEIVCSAKSVGFGGAVGRAWNYALASGQPWVFWLEDDFEIKRPVNLNQMARVMQSNGHLIQMALRRQAWFPGEKLAGGVVELHPDRYTDHAINGYNWLEHREFFTTNPCLLSRRFLAENTWPNKRNSEATFGTNVLRGGKRSGYWGTRQDEPWVIHDGERIGHGY